MGWRAIRVGLDKPGVLRMQLQALIRAAAGRPLTVMFPFVAEQGESATLGPSSTRPWNVSGSWAIRHPQASRWGPCLETPSLAFAPDAFFREVNFLSIGGNDLKQFFFSGRPRKTNWAPPLRHARHGVSRVSGTHRGQGARPMARRSAFAAKMRAGRSRRWCFRRSAFACCRCARRRGARQAPVAAGESGRSRGRDCRGAAQEANPRRARRSPPGLPTGLDRRGGPCNGTTMLRALDIAQIGLIDRLSLPWAGPDGSDGRNGRRQVDSAGCLGLCPGLEGPRRRSAPRGRAGRGNSRVCPTRGAPRRAVLAEADLRGEKS